MCVMSVNITKCACLFVVLQSGTDAGYQNVMIHVIDVPNLPPVFTSPSSATIEQRTAVRSLHNIPFCISSFRSLMLLSG